MSTLMERQSSQYHCSTSHPTCSRSLDCQRHGNHRIRKENLYIKLRAYSQMTQPLTSCQLCGDLNASRYTQKPRQAVRRFFRCQASASQISRLPQATGRLAQQCVKGGVLEATVGATFKLFLVCGFVGWLLTSGRISEDTAPILSKVAFNMMLPCMLFTSLASTLTNNFQWSMLAIPLIAIIQVGIGALGGKLAVWIVEGRRKKKPGWHPLNPTKSADRIAQSTAMASMIPLASDALLPDPDSSPKGTKELIMCCCAYGNSFTLPSVFMMSLLSASAFNRATGYTALFLMAWSPTLWGYGYKVMSSAAGSNSEEGPLHSFDESDMETAQLALKANPDKKNEPQEATLQTKLALRRWFSATKRKLEQTFNPPLVGIALGILTGMSPLGKPLFASTGSMISPTNGVPIELNFCLGILKVGVETLNLLASATLAMQTTVLAASLFQKLPEHAENEQDKSMFRKKNNSGAPQVLGQNLGVKREVVETRALTKSNVQDVQMFRFSDPKDWKKGRSDQQLDLPAPKTLSKECRKKSVTQNLIELVVPRSVLEWKIIAAISSVRFGLVPIFSFAVVCGFQNLGWMPSDPVAKLAILIQACMPSAQNLTLVVNLQKKTQFLAPKLAKLLLQLYVLSVIPVTIWITFFVSSLGVPMSAL